MENFTFYNPVKIHFGRNAVGGLGEAAQKLGKSALLVYGGGSVKRNGSYQDTRNQLEKEGIDITEFNGIMPNPTNEMVDAASALGREKKVDMVVAVGGGSAIDSAKLIAVCIGEDRKSWDVMKGKVDIRKPLSLIAVLTLAATGTEMNDIAVVQNNETMEKFGYRHPLMFPKHSFLDPAYTSTLPAEQTAYGIADLVAHALEAYFGIGDAPLSDRLVEGIILEAMEAGPGLMEDPENYELRSRIMWAATNALNGLTLTGRQGGDFSSHALGHQLSLLYNTPHGASLTIAFPAWMKHMKPKITERLEKLGGRLFGEPDADKAIAGLENFFRSLGCPTRLKHIRLDESNRQEILSLMNQNKSSGRNPDLLLDDNDRESILEFMMQN